jgi:hypothetical protein
MVQTSLVLQGHDTVGIYRKCLRTMKVSHTKLIVEIAKQDDLHLQETGLDPPLVI